MVHRTFALTPGLLERLDAEAARRNVTTAAVLRWAATLGLRELGGRDDALHRQDGAVEYVDYKNPALPAETAASTGSPLNNQGWCPSDPQGVDERVTPLKFPSGSVV
jgi:hypothetical protein